MIGSSPRVWGTFEKNRQIQIGTRFIPTGVGNIYSSSLLSYPEPVHPHGCGEHLSKYISSLSVIGSSPRVWGTYEQRNGNRSSYRFIPTGVGNI